MYFKLVALKWRISQIMNLILLNIHSQQVKINLKLHNHSNHNNHKDNYNISHGLLMDVISKFVETILRQVRNMDHIASRTNLKNSSHNYKLKK